MRRHHDHSLDNRRARWTVVVTSLTVAVLALAGCGSNDASAPADAAGVALPPASAAPAASAQPSASAAVGASPVTYRVPAKGCDGVDTSALDQILGAVKFRHQTVSRSKVLAQATCSVTYAGHVLTMQVGFAREGTGELMYQGLRGAQSRQSPVTDLPGVGSGAYTYTDPVTGPHVAAWDGNLYVSVGLTPLMRSSGAQRGTEALPQVVSATLVRMRS